MELNSQLGKDKVNEKDLGVSSAQPSGKPREKIIQNPTQTKKGINLKEVINWVVFLLVLLVVGYLGYLIYNAYTYTPSSHVTELKLIDDNDVIKRIDQSNDQGKPVSTSESGYERPDPFERY